MSLPAVMEPMSIRMPRMATLWGWSARAAAGRIRSSPSHRALSTAWTAREER